MTPLTNEQALAELRKFAGVQFDRCRCLSGRITSRAFRPGRRPEPQIPLIAQAADRMNNTATLQELPGATGNPASPTAPTTAAAKQV
jgi:hypothetical protein